MGITNILGKHTIYKKGFKKQHTIYKKSFIFQIFMLNPIIYYQMKHPRIPKQEGDCDLRMG